MGGDTSVEAPQPTDEERALQREQVELLRQQRAALTEQSRLQNLIMPLLGQQYGFAPTYGGEPGVITGFELTPEALARADVERELTARSLAALRGELPVSPTLERELGEREETVRETLRRQLGPGFEVSTPGIETLREYEQMATELREGARRGELTLSEQLALARQGAIEGTTAGGAALPAYTTPNLLPLTQAYDMPLRQLQNEREMALRTSMAQAQYGGNLWGTLAGIGLGAFAGGAGSAIGGAIGRNLFSINNPASLAAINGTMGPPWRGTGGIGW